MERLLQDSSLCPMVVGLVMEALEPPREQEQPCLRPRVH
jgi:hypothetical protein